MTEQAQLSRFTELMSTDEPLSPDSLRLQVGDFVVQVRSNSKLLLQRLQHYFRHIVSHEMTPAPSVQLLAIQRDNLDLELPFRDWQREQGKSGRKDAVLEIEGGRLIHKVRTGMLFLQCQQQPIAAGDCLANDNQVINFINAQFMNWLQQHDWLICHGAAIECQGMSIALAAFSGGGKSTSMLRLLDLPGCNFLTNDRLFILKASATAPARAAGIPKLPRINPGTILANPRLRDILSPERQQQLQLLPKQALWELEEKYDVDVLATYGAERINHLAALDCLLILNWQHNDEPLLIQEVNLDQRRDLLAAIMKSPGPFYQQADGQFVQDLMALDEQRYIDTLQSVPVFEVSGGVDFDGLVAWCRQRLGDLCLG